jgi:hypothetical protein
LGLRERQGSAGARGLTVLPLLLERVSGLAF